MTNEELNTALYEKMFTEQTQFLSQLITRTPIEILDMAYEYRVREDILTSMEYNDLSDKQAQALLQRNTPLKDISEAFEKRETEHMNDIWDTVECVADSDNSKEFAVKRDEGR